MPSFGSSIAVLLLLTVTLWGKVSVGNKQERAPVDCSFGFVACLNCIMQSSHTSAFGPSPHDPRFSSGHQGTDANAQGGNAMTGYYAQQAMQYAMNNPNNVFAQEQARV